jgi:hypothetical protein
VYLGASLLKNRKGPMMLPAQYAMNIMALTVAFFVYPATFDDTRERERGMPDAKEQNM